MRLDPSWIDGIRTGLRVRGACVCVGAGGRWQDEIVPILQQFGHVALHDLVGVCKAISLYGN